MKLYRRLLWRGHQWMLNHVQLWVYTREDVRLLSIEYMGRINEAEHRGYLQGRKSAASDIMFYSGQEWRVAQDKLAPEEES